MSQIEQQEQHQVEEPQTEQETKQPIKEERIVDVDYDTIEEDDYEDIGIPEIDNKEREEREFWRTFGKEVGKESPEEIIAINNPYSDRKYLNGEEVFGDRYIELEERIHDWRNRCRNLRENFIEFYPEQIRLENDIIMFNNALKYMEKTNKKINKKKDKGEKIFIDIDERMNRRMYSKILGTIVKLTNLYKKFDSKKCSKFLLDNGINWNLADKRRIRNELFKPKKN